METAARTFLCSVSEQLSEDSSIEVWETGGMGDWNRPRHLVQIHRPAHFLNFTAIEDVEPVAADREDVWT